MKLLSRILTFFVVTVLFTTFSFAKSDKEKSFTIFQDKTKIAEVKISLNKNELSATIDRVGQFKHTYTKSFATGDVKASIGSDAVFQYNNKSGDYKVESKQSNVRSLKWSEIQNFVESATVRTSLAQDMNILQAIRKYDSSTPTRSFELAYVILTADESIYWSENSDYTVRGDKNVKIKFASLLSDCSQGCDTRLSNCVRDVQPDQRIECYRIADACHARCDQVQPEEPPAY